MIFLTIGWSSLPRRRRSVTVVLEDDLVDTCRPGDDVFVTGVLTIRWVGGMRPDTTCNVQHFLHANCVTRVKTQQRPALEGGSDGATADPMAYLPEFASYWERARADGACVPLEIAGRNHALWKESGCMRGMLQQRQELDWVARMLSQDT